jgi:hypothetical protein
VTEEHRMRRAPLESLRHRAEPLWIAVLAIHFIVLGAVLVPALIHLVGRGGQTETVEWAIYMLLLVGYVPLVWLIARVLPRDLSSGANSAIRLTIVAAAMVELLSYARNSNWIFLVSAVLAAVVTRIALGYNGRGGPGFRWDRGLGSVRLLPFLVTGTFAWMCAGSLISWNDALAWLSGSPTTAIILLAAVAITAFALRGVIDASPEPLRPWDYLAIAALALFAFRTYPVVEFYHWGFYVGPIEQLHQGGRLLWDTPSQYGFLSIIIPTLLPGGAWLAFWFYQSVIFAIVAALMYNAFRRVGTGWVTPVFAFLVTLTTLYFRPRDDALILPAQMTPSGGPVRFLWCFVLLAFIAAHFGNTVATRKPRDFAVWGTLIWLASIVWSAEGAIYCTAIWLASYTVFLGQQAAAWREQEVPTSTIARRLARYGAFPLVGIIGIVAIVVLAYFAIVGMLPDWRGYLEYIVLYSRGGFGALPVDHSGSVWYLMLLFVAITTVTGMFFAANVGDPRLVLLAGIWGGAWSVGSYFVGRSHPVNVLSLTPFLLFSVALIVPLLKSERHRRWHRLIFVALVPAFAMPITLTLGHANFRAAITERQLPLGRFTEQLPPIEPSLYQLLRHAGARPSDSFVRIGDGRWMLPAWPIPARRDGGRIVSVRSWLPKPYEIIGSLPAQRRQTYIDRDAVRFPEAGWLIHSKHDTIQKYPEHLAQIERVRHEERRYENDDWILSWMVSGPRPLVSSTVPTESRKSSPPRHRMNPDSARR